MSRIPYLVLAAAVFALAGTGAGAAVRATGHDAPAVTHGVVVGDVTAHSAVVWARADREGTLKVHLSGGKHDGVGRLKFRAADDYTGQVVLTGLKPDTDYRYRVGSSAAPSRPRPPRTTPKRCASPSAATSPARTSAATRARASRSWRRSAACGRTSSSASAT